MCPITPCDSERVSFLRSLNILDTAPDAAFDRITEAASTITHSPIALVSLVDSDRQWFKSKVGLNVSETRREVAFCSHAIAQCDSKIFVVNDALQDERFKKNHLVVGAPNIRFYAGVPLIVDAGNGCQYKIGTLCVIDKKPRLLLDHHHLVMTTLARLVVTEIDKLRFPSRPQPQSEHAPALAPAQRDFLLTCDCRSNRSGAAQLVEPVGARLTVKQAEAIWHRILKQHQSPQLRIESRIELCDRDAACARPLANDADCARGGRTTRMAGQAPASPAGSAATYDADSDTDRACSDDGDL